MCVCVSDRMRQRKTESLGQKYILLYFAIKFLFFFWLQNKSGLATDFNIRAESEFKDVLI